MSTTPPLDNENWCHVLQPLLDAVEQDVSPKDLTLRDELLSPLFSPLPSPPPSQTALALPGPPSPPPPVVTEPVIPEDPTLWGSALSPPPPPPPSQSALVLPGPPPPPPPPAPPVVTGGIEPQTTAPPVPFAGDTAVNDALEGVTPELIEAPRPKQSRAATKRGPKQKGSNRVKKPAKPPKPLSANQQQKQWDREGMALIRQRQADMMAAEMVAAQPVYGAQGQVYGQGQFGQFYGQTPLQVAPGHYSQAAGPFDQQPPVPLPLGYAPAPHLAPPVPPLLGCAPAPAPAPAAAPHLAPPPPQAATWQPLWMPQQEGMYQQPQNWYNI
ncbi:hypothetical protein H9Q74_007240 [Fusarium xylarioides]|nr:hypothetical protein H9Q74_007240 [Fusarium xylarioides]